MTDRELLELAAKAAGIQIAEWSEIEEGYRREDGGYFRPLSDSADALRLAVKLRLMIAWDRWNDNDYACIRHRDLNEEIGRQIDQSPEQTVRRAIVQAAAEIGRAM